MDSPENSNVDVPSPDVSIPLPDIQTPADTEINHPDDPGLSDPSPTDTNVEIRTPETPEMPVESPPTPSDQFEKSYPTRVRKPVVRFEPNW